MNWKNIISNNGKDVSKGKFFSAIFLGLVFIGEMYIVVVEHKFADIPQGLLFLIASLLGYNGFTKFLFYRFTGKIEHGIKDIENGD